MIKHIRVPLALALVAAGATNAHAVTWVPGNASSCSIACGVRGRSAVSSGNYVSGQPYFVCATNYRNGGFRPGYNLVPSWANVCVVGYGGEEKASGDYICLCE